MPRYYEFEVTLQDLEPRIWRRFLLRTTSNFAQLHQAIQQSFGWQECHLWEFIPPDVKDGPIAGPKGGVAPDAKTIKLNTYFTGKKDEEWCEYLYDFGDNWSHIVHLVEIHSDKATFKRKLLDGARAAPPEDCGGLPGYERILHFLKTGEDSYDDDPEGLAAWLGGWQADGFELKAAKARFDK